MKVISSKLPVFTNVTINPFFQILSEDNHTDYASLCTYVLPPLITPFTHVPLIHDTFPQTFQQVANHCQRVNAFCIWESNH
jgi:hypothetical protein